MPFPRLQKRGPIEARSRSCWVSRSRSFHAYKSVAPLKHMILRLARKVGVFPRLQKRGPIEAAIRL